MDKASELADDMSRRLWLQFVLLVFLLAAFFAISFAYQGKCNEASEVSKLKVEMEQKDEQFQKQLDDLEGRMDEWEWDRDHRAGKAGQVGAIN